jgi:hypothetical protein
MKIAIPDVSAPSIHYVPGGNDKMKVQLDYSYPDDEDCCEWALKSPELVSAIQAFRDHLRNEIKYNSEKYTLEQLKTLEEVRDTFWATLQDYNVAEFF